MESSVRSIFRQSLRDLRSSWRALAITDVVYKTLAFAILVPVTTLLLYLLRAGTSDRVVADVEIAMFFLTTPAGIATIVLGGSLLAAITAVQAACLMAIGLGKTQGVDLDVRSALRFSATRAFDVLRLAAHMVLRVIAALIPFGVVGGLVYLGLLREHDINYYLAERPTQFWIAGAIGVALGLALLLLLARTIARWAFAMPLVLFENVHPRRALGESATRASQSRTLILTTLALWALFAVALATSTAWLVQFAGREIAPQLAGSLVLLLVFVATLAIAGAVLALAIGVVNFSLFSLLITHLYLSTSDAKPASMSTYATSGARGLTARGVSAIVAVSLLVVVGIVLLAFLANRGQTPAVVIAHRGSSATAPENTLAAFRLAGDQLADFVELDVQESSDGEVVVVHDSDLMKVGSNPIKIWEGDAAALRAVDIGSFKDPSFASERVPTLAEALAACKGRCSVIVELKSYGHNQRLEERVVEIVEAAGMEKDCVYMSLDHAMVRKMKTLRPNWRVGLLVAKAIGDLTELEADFLAVEARMATRRFIWRAHRAGQEVYIWTVNDPAWMFVGLSRGVDGLITDKPDVAREVIELRARMSEPQRFLTAQLIRFGATTESLAAEDALRP